MMLVDLAFPIKTITSRETPICIGPEIPICVGLGSDGTGLEADHLKLICVVCENDADLLPICVARNIRCGADDSPQHQIEGEFVSHIALGATQIRHVRRTFSNMRCKSGESYTHIPNA